MSKNEKERYNKTSGEPLFECEGRSQLFGMKIPGAKYQVYSDRIVATSGITSTKTRVVPNSRLGPIECWQTFLGKLFKCGTITVYSYGRDIPNLVMHVKHPEDVIAAISDCISPPKKHNPKYNKKFQQNEKQVAGSEKKELEELVMYEEDGDADDARRI